jgi:hypothetical protein
VRTSLEGISEPTSVEVDVVVATENVVRSPMSGVDAALIVIDVVERVVPLEREVGRVVLGDTLILRADDGAEIAIVARRAQYRFVGNDTGGATLDRIPPEIAAVLGGARGGELAWREHVLRHGERVRVRAVVERTGAGRFAARVDIAPVVVSEIF